MEILVLFLQNYEDINQALLILSEFSLRQNSSDSHYNVRLLKIGLLINQIIHAKIFSKNRADNTQNLNDEAFLKILDLALCLVTSNFKEGRSVGINCIEILCEVLNKM